MKLWFVLLFQIIQHFLDAIRRLYSIIIDYLGIVNHAVLICIGLSYSWLHLINWVQTDYSYSNIRFKYDIHSDIEHWLLLLLLLLLSFGFSIYERLCVIIGHPWSVRSSYWLFLNSPFVGLCVFLVVSVSKLLLFCSNYGLVWSENGG